MKMSAVCFVTHYVDKYVERQIQRLYDELGDREDLKLFIMYNLNDEHTNDYDFTKWSDKIEAWKFDEAKLDELRLPYKEGFDNRDRWQNPEMPMLGFWKEHQGEFWRFWFIEYDVWFNGDWNVFFDRYKPLNCKTDLLASHVRKTEDSWYWKGKYNDPNGEITDDMVWNSFNPIIGVTDRLISYLYSCYEKGMTGYFEAMFAICVNHFNKYAKGERDRAMKMENLDFVFEQGAGEVSISSVRYTPPVYSYELVQENVLYHPLKSNTIDDKFVKSE